MDNKLTAGIVGIFLIGLTFVTADCSFGTTKYFQGACYGHHYVASWVETSVSTDSDGKTSTSVIYHPEEFHLLCRSDSGERFDCNSSRKEYYAVADGQMVSIKTRQGRWTKHHWIPSALVAEK